MLENVRPTFLYPTSRQFPVDAVCEAIVRELEKRNWEVPGISVEFNTYGSGHQKFRLVRYIIGENFKLWFCRIQRTMPGGHWNDTAAVTELIIPRKELHVHEDESGPTLRVYVGNDWEADREWFMRSAKVNTRLHNEPRRHLEYSGSISLTGKSYYPGRRPPYLVTNSDLGRQYTPEEGEPTHYDTAAIMEEFRQWLEENVLNVILSQPEKAASDEAQPQPTPFPTDKVGAFYAFIEWRDANRIEKGQANPDQLPANERYALNGGGWRLVPLDAPNDGTVPEIAYDGFMWCLLGEVKPGTSIDDLPQYVGGHYRWDAKYVAAVKPKFAEGIYIADMEPQKRYKRELFEQNPNQERMTNAQYAEYLRVGGRTIVPVTEYEGGYSQPIVLVNRELDFDEVELIIKPEKSDD